MLLGNSNLWLNLREIQINSVLLIGQLELFITKNRLYPVLFFKRYCFQLSPRKTHCKFDPRVLGHPVYFRFCDFCHILSTLRAFHTRHQGNGFSCGRTASPARRLNQARRSGASWGKDASRGKI
jgi:hypothetical protein